MKIIAFLIFLVTPSVAQNHTPTVVNQPCDYTTSVIIPQLKANNIGYSQSDDGAGNCILSWTPVNGVTITYSDRAARIATLTTEVNGLENLLVAGTITQVQLYKLIEDLMLLLNLSQNQ